MWYLKYVKHKNIKQKNVVFSNNEKKIALFSVFFNELDRTSEQIIYHNQLLISGNLNEKDAQFTKNNLDHLRKKKRMIHSLINGGTE